MFLFVFLAIIFASISLSPSSPSLHALTANLLHRQLGWGAGSAMSQAGGSRQGFNWGSRSVPKGEGGRGRGGEGGEMGERARTVVCMTIIGVRSK
eukprot:767352-Hanusia_phi.AAC.2